MSPDAIVLSLFAMIWIGWPLHNIAHDLRLLRKLARKEP